jgi:hypothetical protein
MTLVIIKRDTIEHEAEIIHDDGTQIEVCYEHNGKEFYGRALRSSLKVHGPRADLWYDLSEQNVTWTITRDLDNLETWE